jgi:hypothetical protein
MTNQRIKIDILQASTKIYNKYICIIIINGKKGNYSLVSGRIIDEPSGKS